MTNKRAIKVLIAKPGLDGHNRGGRILTLGLRDEGMDVIYTGLRKTPEEIVERAAREFVDVIGLSILSGAHNTLLPKVVELARGKGLDRTLIIAGGVIPTGDVPFLQEKGISAVFNPGTTIKQVADYIRQNVKY
ncbi:MAG: cobalamin B12-binding domain-containing protein [Candidatus Contubernalis sp.]|nr:cobalamin B12-binding domain-containing protein [Candidatus Contubernalis sp.]